MVQVYKIAILFLLWIVLVNKSFSQIQTNKYNSSQFEFIGYQNHLPIYKCNFPESLSWTKKNSLYAGYLNSSGEIQMRLILDLNKTKYSRYINDYLHIYSIADKLILDSLDSSWEKIIKNLSIRGNLSYDSINNLIFVNTFYKRKNKSYQRIGLIKLSLDSINLQELPIIGYDQIIYHDFVYFRSYHVCNKYSVTTHDIYRVRIGDWNNPELILEDLEHFNWTLLSLGIIYNHISLIERGFRGRDEKAILYNIDSGKYSIIDRIPISASRIYRGKEFWELKARNEPIIYQRPSYPEVYEYEDIRELPCRMKGKLIFNLPLSAKQFTETFITDELLYNAGKEELKTLDNSKLRLLRNAFYARQGYRFKSKDLEEFFGQFNWYNNLVESNDYFEINNDNIVITNDDKSRVELIREVEQGRN